MRNRNVRCSCASSHRRHLTSTMPHCFPFRSVICCISSASARLCRRVSPFTDLINGVADRENRMVEEEEMVWGLVIREMKGFVRRRKRKKKKRNIMQIKITANHSSRLKALPHTTSPFFSSFLFYFYYIKKCL